MLSDCDEYNSDMPDLEEEEEDPSESTQNHHSHVFTKRQLAKMAVATAHGRATRLRLNKKG